MTLKLAEASDYSEVIRMAKAFHEASPYADLEFSEERCRGLFDHYLRGDRRELVIILATDKDRIFGMIIGFSNHTPFSDEKVAAELAWWVDEDKRKSKDSLLLFKAYEDWALRIGAKINQMAMLDDVTDLSGFYLKQGYSPAERSYIKRI